MTACVFCGALVLYAVGLCVFQVAPPRAMVWPNEGGGGTVWPSEQLAHHIAMLCLKVSLSRPSLTGLRDLFELCSPQNIWRNAMLSISMFCFVSVPLKAAADVADSHDTKDEDVD